MFSIFLLFLIARVYTIGAEDCGQSANSKLVLEENFNISPDSFFDLVYKSRPWHETLRDLVLKEGHEIVIHRSTDFNMTEWFTNDKGLQERNVSYMMHPNSSFVATASVDEIQTVITRTPHSFVVHRHIQNKGFLFANSFSVEVRTCGKIVNDTMLNFKVYAEVVGTGGFFFVISSNVETGTFEGLTEYYTGLQDVFNAYTDTIDPNEAFTSDEMEVMEEETRKEVKKLEGSEEDDTEEVEDKEEVKGNEEVEDDKMVKIGKLEKSDEIEEKEDEGHTDDLDSGSSEEIDIDSTNSKSTPPGVHSPQVWKESGEGHLTSGDSYIKATVTHYISPASRTMRTKRQEDTTYQPQQQPQKSYTIECLLVAIVALGILGLTGTSWYEHKTGYQSTPTTTHL